MVILEPETHWQGAAVSENLVIYTKPGCPYCAAAKEDFAGRGLEYIEYDISADPARKEEAIRLAGGVAAVPVIVDHGEVSVGFGGS